MSNAWKICSICKKDIAFGAAWYACSVSTCNRARTALYFCSVECWDAHLPEARHRDAWAEPQTAPSREAYERELRETADRETARSATEATEPTRRRIVGDQEADLPKDVLVVVSKLKTYVRARSGMNTSDGVTGPLSDHLRALCAEAIRHAAADGRKTVLDRDIVAVLERWR